MLIAVCHSDESGWTEIREPARISDLRDAGHNLLWAEADVATLDENDIAVISEEFGLHPLAVEDAIHVRQRPKLDRYGRDLFLVVHQLDEIDDQLEPVQIACFIGNDFLLTLHAGARRTLAEATRRWEARPPHDDDPTYLLHVLLDVVVDDYQAIADTLEQDVEELEEIALATPLAPIQRQLYSLRQRLARLRRFVLPGTRLLEGMMEPGDETVVPQRAAELFRDVHDHLLRIGDQVRNVDDLSQAVLDLTRAEQAARLNEGARKLSAWAAIFAVGTLIAGVYGMNFELVPDELSLFGFWFALGLMAVSSAILFSYFKKKGWL